MSGFFPRGAILAGFGEPLTLFKKLQKCSRCGYPNLYWHQHDGKWKLHHYSMPDGATKPGFYLHRCGFDSNGKRKPAALTPTNNEVSDEG